MTIEFYTPDKVMHEWLIIYVRDAILKLHRQHREISRAVVCFKERRKQVLTEKICEIDLSISKDAIMVTGAGKSFDTATRKALEELNDTIALHFKSNNKLPDQVVSTVDI